jgi:hypothetical protein
MWHSTERTILCSDFGALDDRGRLDIASRRILFGPALVQK